MAGSAKNWLIGCGLGCGLLIALGVGLGAAGYFGVRHVAKRAEGLEAARDSLVARFGPPEAYVPPADGSLPPERIEAFLMARHLMAPVRERTSRTLAVLDGTSGASLPARLRAGVDFVPHMLAFIEDRDRALLKAGLGAGEYQYLYCLAYFDLLGKDPGDGPGFDVVARGDGGEGGRDWTLGSRRDSGGDSRRRETVRREREDLVREELNRFQRENLRRQLESLDAQGGGDGARAAWRARLAAELKRLTDERRSLAWEQGLPPATQASLEPFRDRLEQSYDAMTGVLELHLDSDDEAKSGTAGDNGDGSHDGVRVRAGHDDA